MKYILLALLALAANAAASEESEQRAIQLIDQMEEIYRGDASIATLTMTIETPEYQRSLTLESKNKGTENSLIRILEPARDRGITTLKLGEEMWNYFPKINKVIKVPPSMMMGSWMGSDFTNDDLVQQTKLTDEYSLSLEETADRYNITLIPKQNTVTVWGRIDYLIDKQMMLPVGQRYYDDKGVTIRELTFSEPRDYGGILLPSRLTMVPLNKKGHKTTVSYDALEFNSGDVTDDDFTLRNLKSQF